ncbi:MAG: NAD(P)/FAD-dependent oxidoreductase [Dehalococcoidia bacterium]
MSSESIVIVGAGRAGGWAARTLRNEGFAGTVVLIGDEPHAPPARPPLSKTVPAGEALPESPHLLKPDAFGQLALDWRRDSPVTSLDRKAKQVILADGESIGYDRLILCTGGRARALNVPGADLARIFTLRTIDDAVALGPMLQPENTVVVVGGGWTGLEVAAAARKNGAEAVVIEVQPRLCERTVPPEISAYLLALHTARGAQVLLSASVSGFARNDHGRLVVALGDGREISCDAIVVGVGLIPNDELARAAGLECAGGIVVDAHCRTSDPDILAAGDVTVTPSAWAGRPIRLESWQNAQEQAIAAARSALGIEVTYEPLPWFWSHLYEMNLQIYGIPSPSHRTLVRGRPNSGSFMMFFLDDDRVQAVLGPTATRDLRFARRLIERQKPVSVESLADTEIPMSTL